MKTLSARQKFKSNIQLPGDKSISHRCLILSSLSEGDSILENVSLGKDVLATQNVLRQMGIFIEENAQGIVIRGQGVFWKAAKIGILNCENAGTLMRLMMGVLSGQKFTSQLIGDESLMTRPMDRVANPLIELGAHIELNKTKAPVHIFPSSLSGGQLFIESPSAQVKSALMFASIFCKDKLTLDLKYRTRNHTELLFPFYGIQVDMQDDLQMTLYPQPKIRPVSYKIPCDPSAATFWIVASFLSGQSLHMNNVCLNPSRLGSIQTLKSIGLNVLTTQKDFNGPEVVGDVSVTPSDFDGFDIGEDQLPFLIDEIPVLAILATQSKTKSIIRNARELRYKETDRIWSIQKMFESLGLKIDVDGDSLIIPGRQILNGGVVDSYGDHRIAMAAAIASTASLKPITILNSESAEISDPYFWGNFLC